jgi:uncharacterized protein (DUF302 family)
MTVPEGLITTRSRYGMDETAGRFRAAVEHAGLSIFAEVDHAGAAAKVDMPLRPTLLLMFGNPRAGTPLMQLQQTAGIDLPLKVLIWQGDDGAVSASYTDPHWIAARHALGPGAEAPVTAMASGIAKLVQAATA